MAEDDGTTPEGGTSNAGGGDGYTPPASQADLDKIIGERLARERQKYADYDDLKERAAQFTALEEASKTDVQRLEERASKAEGEIPGLKGEVARLRVALAKGLPAELVDRLRGETAEEIEKDADDLLKLVGTRSTTPDLRHAAGQRPMQSTQSADDWLRQMAGRG